MNILAAPIQEYTDASFRNAHAATIGGIDEYYTPFIRLERGALSRRSAMDIAPASNTPANIVPQILVASAEETHALLDILADNGYSRADINFGCPFPKVVKGGYGAAVLENHDAFRSVLEEASRHASMRISIKMRLGMSDAKAALALTPILNDAPLDKIVLHPRTALQQY
ncbi:MAG: tRNA-dihydrouridine synthase family protein, partial [Lentisphaeria bacterium]|nr:tRNA-dihydrouridine synthase family protein [Lentisphaeria bacterium]